MMLFVRCLGMTNGSYGLEIHGFHTIVLNVVKEIVSFTGHSGPLSPLTKGREGCLPPAPPLLRSCL